MNIFIQVMVPILIVFIVGFTLQKIKPVDVKPISTLAIYIMSPSLVFRTLYTSELNLQYVYMIFFSVFLLISIILINKIYISLRKLSVEKESGLILSTAFMNAGNYGVPVVLFAYGETAFTYSVLFLVIQSLIMNIFGIYYAAKGKNGVIIAIQSIFHMPVTYVVFVTLTMKLIDISIPEPLFTAIDTVAAATIPTIMLILGMQLALIKWGDFDWPNASFGVVTRLILSPLISYCLLLFIPMDPLASKVLIVMCAMPTAATIVMYAVQFQTEPQLVSSVTLWTTIGSVLSVTILLMIL